jgi:hypothetical protein
MMMCDNCCIHDQSQQWCCFCCAIQELLHGSMSQPYKVLKWLVFVCTVQSICDGGCASVVLIA